MARRGDLDQAEVLAAEATDRWRALGEPGWVALSLRLQGYLCRRRGAAAPAAAFCEEALAQAQSIASPWGIAQSLRCLGGVEWLRGDYRRSAARYAEALALARTHGFRPQLLDCLDRLAALAQVFGQPERAARLVGGAAVLREALELPIDLATHSEWDEAMAAARAGLGAAAFAAAEAAGRALLLDEAVAEAMAVAGMIAGRSTVAHEGVGTSHGLTRRELDVLRLLNEGATDREIAAALFVSPRTVGAHVSSILRKLGVETRRGARAYARHHGLG